MEENNNNIELNQIANLKALKKIFSFIGLAKKAGKISGGEVAVVNAIKKKTATLLLVATDSSDNTRKKFNNSAEFYNIPILEFGSKEELGNAIGEDFRAVLCINDEGFSKKIQLMISELV